jgi:serine/threonine protein kinase
MADVFLATRGGVAGFNKLLVLKVLKPSLRVDPDFVAMFLDEARLSARLSHPNVVQTYEIADPQAGYFITLEYLDGQPLQHVTRRFRDKGGLRPEAGVRIVAEALAGLHYAHELRDYDGSALDIVHRDVSPHNVFVTYAGEIKIVDFGIAKACDSSLETRLGMLKGKVGYVSPEQARGDAVTRSADIYGAGVILWELLARRRMWAGVAEATILKRLAAGDIPTLEPGDAPPDLREIVSCAVAPDARDRFPTAQAFADDLVQYLGSMTGAPDARDIGALVASAFEPDRARLRGLVLEQLENPENTAVSLERVLGLPSLTATESSQAAVTGRTSPLATSIPPYTPRPPSTVATPPAAAPATSTAEQETRVLPGPTRRALPWLAIAGGAALVLLLAVPVVRLVRSSPAAALSPNPRTAAAARAEHPVPARGRVPAEGRCERANKPIAELSGDIDSDATLRCDESYLLKFTTFVKPGVTLTIEKGTTLYGDTATKGTLVVQPGGRIVAEGSADLPIVLTSENTRDGSARPGDWGGLIVLGNAPTNLRGADGGATRGRIEGITSGGEYGGSDPDDDSGVLSYVRIEYGGTKLAPNNEINGLTLGGVGRRTRLDHIQVRSTSDDCFEFFGGTVNAKYLVCQAAGDDGIDWDFGYRGKIQFVVVQSREAAEGESNGFEGDNDPNGSENAPLSEPSIFNATLCGPGRPGKKPNFGLLLRHATRAHLANLLVTGYDAGFDVRDRTQPDVRSSAFFENFPHALAFPETASGTGPLADDDYGTDERALIDGPRQHNLVKNPGFAACGAGAPRPSRRLAEHAATPPADGFFDTSAAYLGAFRDSEDHWDAGRWLVW